MATLIGRRELQQRLGISQATTSRHEKKGIIPSAIRRQGMQPKWIWEEVEAALGLTGK